jgi:hypothetical protein
MALYRLGTFHRPRVPIAKAVRSVSTIAEARALLDVTSHVVDARSLRLAYYREAKRCHPDQNASENAAHDFLRLTKAYEILQREAFGNSIVDETAAVTIYDESAFRKECERKLGVPAETVEECKRCPMFRIWLTGHTESAIIWRNFFMENGGLLPMLKRSAGALQPGDKYLNSATRNRRKRKG